MAEYITLKLNIRHGFFDTYMSKKYFGAFRHRKPKNACIMHQMSIYK